MYVEGFELKLKKPVSVPHTAPEEPVSHTLRSCYGYIQGRSDANWKLTRAAPNQGVLGRPVVVI